MLENLTNRLDGIFKKLRGYGKLNETTINEALREVRTALLESDINLKVAREFIEKVKGKALGHAVMESLTPGQQVIKVVREELIALLGDAESKLEFSSSPPTTFMMVGLQGSGKTTTCGKIARILKKEGRTPLLVAADIYRPAAIEQLKVLGSDLDIPVFALETGQRPEEICSEALKAAKRDGNGVVIVDTAGRMHVDNELMDELKNLKEILNPHEIIFVADAMTGQDAVNVAEGFKSCISPTGVILTKMDGDARGGAILSIRSVTDIPVKFIGTGEKLDQLEPFYPDRMVSRILGMGDVLTLIDKAEESFDAEAAKKLEKKIRSNRYTLEDYREQLCQIKKMGPLDQLLGMIPGMGKLKGAVNVNEKDLMKIEAVINSMTMKERRNHTIINGSRKKRISKGSGTEVRDVNRLLKQFIKTQKVMKQLTNPGFRKKMGMGRMPLPF